MGGRSWWMWTASHRQRLAIIEKSSKRYPTDLTDMEWQTVEPLLPKPGKTGRRRRVDLREVLNAIRYLARTGAAGAVGDDRNRRLFDHWSPTGWQSNVRRGIARPGARNLRFSGPGGGCARVV